MTLEPGVLALIPFPFSDLSSFKRRPVLVLRGPDGVGDFICLAVTSKGHHAFGVPISSQDLIDGALPLASWVRADKVFTLASALVVRTVARVRPDVLERALSHLCAAVKAPH